MREALEKDGWRITDDPYPLRVDDVSYEIDFGAEPLIAAEKEDISIAVEVKSLLAHLLSMNFTKQLDNSMIILSLWK